MDSQAFAAQLRREAEQRRCEARAAADRDEFNRAALLRAEADELLERADGVDTAWPLRAVAS